MDEGLRAPSVALRGCLSHDIRLAAFGLHCHRSREPKPQDDQRLAPIAPYDEQVAMLQPVIQLGKSTGANCGARCEACARSSYQ